MHMRSMVILATMGGAFLAACSSNSSTAPKPTLAGTWHVSGASLSNGTLSPSSFDITVKASGDTYLVTMPSVTWSVGSVTYDSGAGWVNFSDTSFFGFGEYQHNAAHMCAFVLIWGKPNAAKDTLKTTSVAVTNSDTIAGGFCSADATGSATVTK